MLVLLLLVTSGSAVAATINVSSCSESAVQSAISSASSGDTIVCPAGSWTWTNVDITKNVTLQGAGINQTNITLNACGALESPASYTGPFRVTGFTFISGVECTSYPGYGNFRIYGNKGWRVDHNRFRNYSNSTSDFSGYVIFTRGDVGGLIDHNEIVNRSDSEYGSPLTSPGCIGGIYVEGNGKSAWQLNYSYEDPNHTVFVEDNLFDEKRFCSSTQVGATWGQNGAIFVFRNNEVHNMKVDSHAYEVTIGTRWWSVYNNDLYSDGGTMYRAFHMRGGSGVIYNNTLHGNWSYGVWLEEGRTSSDRGSPGRSELYGGVPAGTSCSSAEGYPCVDQVGRGYQHGSSPNQTQDSDPAYIWNNNLSGASSQFTSTSSYIQSGRDYYYNQGAKPGYTAYTYPHPLATGSGSEPPPPPPPATLIPSPPSIIGVN
jgi:hypothetical protein